MIIVGGSSLIYYFNETYDGECFTKEMTNYCESQNMTFFNKGVMSGIFYCNEETDRVSIKHQFKILESERLTCLTKEAKSWTSLHKMGARRMDKEDIIVKEIILR